MVEEGKAYDLKHRLLEYFERKRKQIPIMHGALHGKSGIDPIPDAVYQEDPVYIRRADGTIINPSTEETLTSVLNKLADILARLDVNLSTRASESTLTGVKAQTDKLTFDASSRLKAQLDSIPNPSNLDVLLSSRASESSLTSTLPRNITQWSGTPLTGRNISLDLAKIDKYPYLLPDGATDKSFGGMKNLASGTTYFYINEIPPAGKKIYLSSFNLQLAARGLTGNYRASISFRYGGTSQGWDGSEALAGWCCGLEAPLIMSFPIPRLLWTANGTDYFKVGIMNEAGNTYWMGASAVLFYV